MAGTEHGGRHERRRFITRQQVEDAAASGHSISVQGRDVVTDDAAQRAADLGVRIERGTSNGPIRPAPAASSSAPAEPSASDADLRRAVRNAVIAELGSEPPGLDSVMERVLTSRSR